MTCITYIKHYFIKVISYFVLPVIKEPIFSRKNGYWTQTNQEFDRTFYGQLTDINSQREDWYQVTPYIAEFKCALSNIGFFYYGIKHESPPLFFAGLVSFVSHSIPKH